MNEFISVAWVITEKCDKDCLICHRFDRHEDDMTFSKQKKVLQHIKSQGVKRVCFTGGEPTLHKSLFDIITYAHKIEISTALTTHGNNLNENDINLLDQILDQILIPVRY